MVPLARRARPSRTRPRMVQTHDHDSRTARSANAVPRPSPPSVSSPRSAAGARRGRAETPGTTPMSEIDAIRDAILAGAPGDEVGALPLPGTFRAAVVRADEQDTF